MIDDWQLGCFGVSFVYNHNKGMAVLAPDGCLFDTSISRKFDAGIERVSY
jgi:hypothetical protein